LSAQLACMSELL